MLVVSSCTRTTKVTKLEFTLFKGFFLVYARGDAADKSGHILTTDVFSGICTNKNYLQRLEIVQKSPVSSMYA